MNGFLEVDVIVGDVMGPRPTKENTERRTICVHGIRVRHSGKYGNCTVIIIPNKIGEMIQVLESYDALVDRLSKVAKVERLA